MPSEAEYCVALAKQYGEGGRAKEDFSREEMRYVYLLESQSHPGKRYVGSTDDLQRRLTEHNAGKTRYTRKFLLWKCVVALRFGDNVKAGAFEKYLKSGSGHAFAKRHLW